MKRRLALSLAVILGIMGIFMFQEKELRVSAAQAVAGKGMLELVKQGREEKPKVALTFDDGPSKRYTPALLDGLKERGVHASFFLMGKNIEGNEEIVRRMEEEGHLVGNHTYNHVQLDKVTRQEAKEEVEKTSNEIFEITGVYPSYVRPPFGAWPKDLEFCITMVPVFWNIDTLDWQTKNADSVVRIVEKNVQDGSIILMHDGYETSVEAALRIVDLLTKEGYEFVTVDELVVV